MKENIPASLRQDNNDKLKRVSFLIGAIEISEGKEPSFGPSVPFEAEPAPAPAEATPEATPVAASVESAANPVQPTVATPVQPAATPASAPAEAPTINNYNPHAFNYATALESEWKKYKTIAIIAGVILGFLIFFNFPGHTVVALFFTLIAFAGLYFLYDKLMILEFVDKKLQAEVPGFTSPGKTVESHILPITISLSVPMLLLLVSKFLGLVLIAIYFCAFFFGSKLIVGKIKWKYNLNSNMVMREFQKITNGR